MSDPRERSVFDAALFDATGTLFFPYPSVGAVYAAAAREHGMAAEAAALEVGFHAAWGERAPTRFAGHAERRTSDAAEKGWWRGTVRRTFELAGLAAPGGVCFEAIFGRFADPACWRVFPDVFPCLAALRRTGLRLGVVSNFDTRLHRICEGLGLAAAVDFVLASAEAGFAKPAPQIFQVAVRRAGTTPGRVVMVGDSVEEDVAGAQAAGCAALLLDRGSPRRGPGVIHSLGELATRLQMAGGLL